MTSLSQLLQIAAQALGLKCGCKIVCSFSIAFAQPVNRRDKTACSGVREEKRRRLV